MLAKSEEIGPYVLGIDLGSHSLGWAVVRLDGNANPCALERAGVRTFEAGVEASYDQMLQGKQKSKAANRRSKRGPRRQFWRRAWRRYKVMKCLIGGGLLRDPGQLDIRKPADQDRYLKGIDKDLRERLRPANDDPRRHLWEQVWLYELRASALERELDPLELGRAFYHLAQRRGFLSNRKTDTPDDEQQQPKKRRRNKDDKTNRSAAQADNADQQEADAGQAAKQDSRKVKAAIEKLRQDMENAIPDPRFRTLGFYFARHVNPEERRIRTQWTSRDMYENEFTVICNAQSQPHPALDKDQPFRNALHDAIFYQRPLKSAGHLVGHCDLERGRKRALQALPIAQEFRLLQKANDLKVLPPDGHAYQPLDEQQRGKLIDALSTKGDRKFKQIRKLLGFIEPKINKETKVVEAPGHTFNLERGGEKQITGDRTAAKILACDKKAKGIAKRWKGMDQRRREELVLALVEFENPKTLARHLQDRFDFTPEQATVLSKVRFEDSRCALSRRALDRLVPYMRDGMSFAAAKEQIPEYRAKAFRQSQALDFLPRVLGTDEKHLPSRDVRFPCFKRARDLRNPAVTRALAELRKVVNAVIRRYGKPLRIHLELGRELKRTPKAREATTKANRERETDKDKARIEIRDSRITWNPDNDDDVRMWLLGKEQGWHCPYCCQSISPGAADLQIDHIIPRSISHDNNMPNLVLCHAECNVKKGKRAPCEAFDPGALAAIQRFATRFRPAKRQRFLWTPEQVAEFYGDKFTPRQLTDTQYAAKLAMQYLGMLYGGDVDRRGVTDERGIRRVQPTSGGVTAILRAEWDLNAVIPSLPDSPAQTAPENIRLDQKLRTDHRHHAVDAVVIACTTPKTIELLSDAARRVERAELRREDLRDSTGRRRRNYAEIAPPWGSQDSFVASVKDVIARINVSHRPERRLRGQLHDETNYSKPFSKDGPRECYRTRRALKDLKPNEVDAIVDDHVRKAVLAKLSAGDPKKVFSHQSNLPILGKTPDGKPVYVKSVRIHVTAKSSIIGNRDGTHRHVKPGANHHMTILAVLKPDGTDGEWVPSECVSRLEAARRKRDFDREQGRLRTTKRSGAQVVIDRTTPLGTRFVLSLQPGDMLQMTRPNQPERLYVVRAISKSQTGNRKPTYRIEYVTAVDARIKSTIKPPKREPGSARRTRAAIDAGGPNQWFNMTTIDELRRYRARKVVISPFGDVIFESKLNAPASQ